MDIQILQQIAFKLNFVTVLVLLLGIINIARTSMLMIGIEIYNKRNKSKVKLEDYLKKNNGYRNFPKFSIIIPAYNEESGILRSLDSLGVVDYPRSKFEIIVVNDGSKDKTAEIVDNFIKNSDKDLIIKLVNQQNSGKARALNNGIMNHSKFELVMCLDADSSLKSDALSHIAYAFITNPKLVSTASSVQIIKTKGLMNFVQRFEYLVCYQMKKAHKELNIEYIIGGIGSVFKRSKLEEVGYYDVNTVTEDIDLTMKILSLGNKENICALVPEAVAYTENVPNLKDLVKQRFRWKWGRCQTFLKNKEMFFNKSKKHNKLLTYIYLPYAIFGDIAYLFEPILFGFILYTSIVFSDPTPLIGAFSFFGIYSVLNIFADKNITKRDQFVYVITLPIIFVLSYAILAYAEYVALIKTVIQLNTLKSSIEKNECHWSHVERVNYIN